jgi:hypothetical protein
VTVVKARKAKARLTMSLPDKGRLARLRGMNLSSIKRRETIPPMIAPTTSVSLIATLLHASLHPAEIPQAGLSPPSHHSVTIRD